ncbi:Semaphorin-2A [Lamellibrachia satsuma]|nr:Semaphorin-2A [Lamellibrachia satsuma]
MEFHPEKFHVIPITRNTNIIDDTYMLNVVRIVVVNIILRTSCFGADDAPSFVPTVMKTFKDEGVGYYRFMALSEDSSVFYVGARNHIYRLHADDITRYEKSPMLNSSVIAKVVCKSRAGFVEEYHCRNHIRYVFEISGTIEVCGTGAYKPRTFELNRTDLSIIQEGGSTSGNGRCPFSPDNNSTAIYIETGNPGNASTIYTASFTDFGGSEPIFYRLSVGNSPFLRSKPNDKYIFLNPHFVRAFDVGDYVYLFFREQAAEEILSTRIYSRVARVCKADRGGASLLVNRWTTYSKVRLVCSDPGDITLYFDELHDVVYEEGIYYGVFTTTSKQRMFASAVCSFTEKRIADAFAGNYKNQESDDNIFNVVATSRVPSTRPSECSPDSQQLSIVVLQFASGHPFMATDVTSESGQALFSHDLIILHRIVVDIRKESKVFFIGSDQGKVYKVVQWTTPAKHHSETLAIWQPFKEVTHIWEMKLLGRRLYISTDDSIVEINVEQCDNYLCPQCVRDPYCDWSVASGNCTVRGTTLWTGSCNCTGGPGRISNHHDGIDYLPRLSSKAKAQMASGQGSH